MSPVNASILPHPIGRQREVLYLPPDGHTVVLGTAGSGKTTLAILRALYLAAPDVEHGGRVLLVTFNRCLVTYMKHLAGTIQGEVVVENYHRFARGYLASKGKLSFQSIADANDRLRFIRNALQEAQDSGMSSSTLQRPAEFFDEEFQWIQQHGIQNIEHYVQAKRIGRATARITKHERVELFSVYTRYLRQRQQNGKLYDWYNLASAVLGELKIDQEKRHYRHVIIDEGQDFSPQMLRSLVALTPQNGSLTFLVTLPSKYMDTGCLGETLALRLAQNQSGVSRRIIVILSKFLSWRLLSRQCRIFRLIRIWLNQLLL